MKMKFALVAGMAAITAACGGEKAQTTNVAQNAPAPTAAPEPGTAPAGNMAGAPAGSTGSATLSDAQDKQVGTATVSQQGDQLQVAIRVTDMAPGTYGAHIHTTGRCEGPKFESAGAHWNPTTRQHGSENPQGPHLGDLPNLTIAADRTGQINFSVPNASLTGGANAVMDADGAAVVIHAGPDDYRTDPSGNSGDRIACGVLAAG